MAVIDMLKIRIKPLYDVKPSWVQYISDHIAELKKSSSKVELLQAEFTSAANRLEYLLKQHNYPVEYSWIVRLVNRIPSDLSLIGLNSILLPDITLINNHYTIFKTLLAANVLK